MAKLTAPLFSMEAAGKLGENLIYQTWRGRPYVRKLTKSRSTPTVHQAAIRRVVAICPHLWQSLPAPYLAEWDIYRPDLHIPPFQKFVGFQIDQHNTRVYDGQGQYYMDRVLRYSPANDDSGDWVGYGTPTLTVTPTHHTIHFPAEIEDFANLLVWGVWRTETPWAEHRVLGRGYNPKTDELRGYVPTGVYEFTDRQFDPDTYYTYRVLYVTPRGSLSDVESEF